MAALLIAARSLPGVDIIRVRAIAIAVRVVMRLQRGDLRLDRVQALHGLAQRGGHQLLALDPHATELVLGLRELGAGREIEKRRTRKSDRGENQIGRAKLGWKYE